MSQLAQGLGYTPGRGKHTPGRNGITPKRTPGVNSTTPGRGGGSSGHIKVVVRVRPPNEREQHGNYRNVVEVLDGHMLVFDPKEQSSPDYYHRKRRQGRDLLKKANKDIRFAFDQVYGMDATNNDIYEQTTKTALDALLDGFNCSVFAYGATGAGKTFTMLGRPDHPGVMFLTMMDLYSRIDAMKETKSCDVAVSYMEVYNEQIRDLLLPSGFLPIREDPEKGTIISGLSLHKPRSAQELMHMLEFGNKNRTQHPTDANAESSRSHAVFQVFVRMKSRTASLSADVTVAKMSLIDLAGSERATVTKNRGARFREGANINRSLLALGNCINALAEGKSKGYIPYRNSKLTRLLKDSLGGNCKTIMIAAVSPSSFSYEDTHNTLKYANRAKNIKANLTRKVVSVDYHVTKYVQIVDELRAEVAELKDKLYQYESGAVLPSKCSRLDDVNMQEISRITSLLYSVFEERISIRKELMEMEGSMRDLAFKIHLKEISIHRIKILITDPNQVLAATAKLDSAVMGFKKRQDTISKRKCAIEARVEENNQRLGRAEAEMGDVQKNSSVPELLDTELRCRHLEVELRDTRRHVRHLKKLCRHQQRSAKSNEEVVSKLLRIVKNQYFILKGHGLATSDINQEFDNLTQLIEGKAGVNFDESVMERSMMSMSELEPVSAAHEFDINPLVEFPVLSCVPITPKTPHRLQSTLSRSGNGLTPKTPITPGDAMTPVTPVTRAWLDDSTVVTTPATSTLPPPRVKPVTPSHGAAQITSSSSCNSSLVGGETGPTHSRAISKAIESTVKQCLNISNLSHTSSAVDTSQMSNLSRMDSTRGSQLSLSSLGSSVASDVGNVRVFGASSKANVNKTNALLNNKNNAPSNNTGQPQTLSESQKRDMNHTFVLDKVLDGVYPLKSESPRPVLGDRTNAVNNAGTVTKQRPTVDAPVVNSNTVTKATTAVNSGTVTKGKADRPRDMMKVIEAAGLRECGTPLPSDRRTSVVRAFNFDGMAGPSPAGQLTFAQALKSPAPLRLLREEHRISSPRSPLTPRTNLPDFDSEERVQGKVTFADDVHFNKERPSSSKKLRQHHPYSSASKIKLFKEPRETGLLRRHSVHVGRNPVSEEVKRLGLPSILEKRDRILLTSASSAASSTGGEVPGYMQLTKAASRRRRNHRRSVSHDENSDRGRTMIPSMPRRIASKENTKPAPNRILMQKSKSSLHIGQKSTFF